MLPQIEYLSCFTLCSHVYVIIIDAVDKYRVIIAGEPVTSTLVAGTTTVTFSSFEKV